MNLESIIVTFADNLIPFMGLLLVSALVFRWLAYRHSKFEGAYFSTFTREVEVNIEKEKEDRVQITSSEEYLSDLLGKVSRKLPNRNVRFGGGEALKEEGPDRRKEAVTLKDFINSKEGLVASIQSESSIFSSKTVPNFTELTHRILEEDKNWTKVSGFIPIEGFSRMIDVLPNIFIVLGVLGTFIGIAMALPEIANINFDDLERSQETLTQFVKNVTFAMKTSIAGIVFSLTLTFLNTAFPIKDMRDRIFKQIETCFQMLWYHIQDDNRKKASSEELLGEILAIMRENQANSSNKKAG